MTLALSLGCDWSINTNAPDTGDEVGDDSGDWKTFFVGDAHIYDPACGVPNFTYCQEPFSCDIDGADVKNKLQSLQWTGTFSNNDLHSHLMWKERNAPPNDGVDFSFADARTFSWFLGHGNVGYTGFSVPHAGDPWASPCVLGAIQQGLGIPSSVGGQIVGGDAVVVANLASCYGYYSSGYETDCVEKNWGDDVRQVLTFGGSPVVAKLQGTEFIEHILMGKDNQSAWLDVMHKNYETPFAENNPVVYTFAAGSDGAAVGTIADDANVLTGDWVKPPVPSGMTAMGVVTHSGAENLGYTQNCLPQSAPIACQ